MESKKLVEIIKRKKELIDLDDEFVSGIVKDVTLKINLYKLNEKSKKTRLIIKEARRQLRNVYGVFKLVKSDRKISSYEKIFGLCGNFKVLLDLGCGLEPLHYTKLNKKARYYCYDVGHDYIKKINNHFKKNKIKGKARILDLTKPNKLPKADVCLILNVLESLEAIERGVSKNLIKKIKAKVIVVGFAKRALGGKKTIRKKGRSWFRKVLKELNYDYKVIDIDNEILFVIKKMKKIKDHYSKKWEISIMELEDSTEKKYKVTRRLPNLSVAETKVFRSKEEAIKQFEEWLK